MKVKELLLESLTRANHIQRGRSAPANELTNALAHFNSQLRIYSDRNLVTAYQKVLDVDAVEEQTIGMFNVKDGYYVHVVKSLPTYEQMIDSYVEERDYFYCGSDFYGFTYNADNDGVEWKTISDPSDFIEYVPDVICTDMNKVMACMVRYDDGWKQLRFVPLTMFYTEDDNYIYCATPSGENKVSLRIACPNDEKQLRIVYNTTMSFDLDDNIELPEIYIELLTLATTCALLSEDVDDDGKALQNYQSQLTEVENQIMAQNSTTRRIQRQERCVRDRLLTGSFIFRRHR